MKLYKKIIISGELKLITGLHIGDSKESTDIGGVDSPVVRRKDNNEPYIPGSSIKGKMRSLLELAHNKENTFNEPSHPIGSFFGALPDLKSKIKADEIGVPSRLIVRDSYLTRKYADKLSKSEFTDMPYSEIKFENVIDRITGTTVKGGIRQIERIPAGSVFEVEFVINIIAENDQQARDDERSFLKLFDSGIKLIENDYLGGSGSRGYGQVKFNLNTPVSKLVESYLNG